MSRGDVIFIVGLGRSGTSALTRVLSLSGCALPESVVAAVDFNPKGCWEPIDIWKLNADFFYRYGTTPGGDPTMRLQAMEFGETEREEYVDKIRAFLSACPRAPVLLIKHPSISEWMDFWLEAARREALAAKVVIPIRHPTEVYASISALDGGDTVSLELSNACWVKLNLLAERHSRALPRVFIEYSSLMTDWRVELARVASALSVRLEPDEAAIDRYLTRDLYRQRRAGPVAETFGYSWTTRVYEILSSAARDGAVDLAALDEIHGAYRASERAFRIAWEEFRRRFERTDLQAMRDGVDNVPVWLAGRDF